MYIRWDYNKSNLQQSFSSCWKFIDGVDVQIFMQFKARLCLLFSLYSLHFYRIKISNIFCPSFLFSVMHIQRVDSRVTLSNVTQYNKCIDNHRIIFSFLFPLCLQNFRRFKRPVTISSIKYLNFMFLYIKTMHKRQNFVD